MADKYAPKPGHKFTFGLWTVGNRGRATSKGLQYERLDQLTMDILFGVA